VNRVSNLKATSVVCAVLLFLAVTLGCGSTHHAQFRFMNVAPEQSPLDVLVNGKKVVSSVAYATASAYTSIGAGTAHVQIEPSGSTSPIIDQNFTFNNASQSTVMLFSTPRLSTVVIADDNTAPTAGNMKLRIINASPALGSADVYVVPEGTDLTTVTPTVTSLAVQGVSRYFTLTPGSYAIFFTAPGQKSPLIDSGAQTLNAGQVRTVVGLNSQLGGYTSIVLPDLK
jgi:hypothetical protein